MTLMDKTSYEEPAIPAGVTAVMLSSQCRSLQTLRIAPADVALEGINIAALAVLTRLRTLEVCTGLHSAIAP